MLDARMCQFIKAIEKNRNFSKAAKELYVAQPYLSRYVQSLEKELGVQIFNRKKIPLEVLPAGERLLEYIAQFEELTERMRQEFAQLGSKTGGHLSIGAWHYFGTYFLPQIVPTFLARYPGVWLNVREYDAKDIESALLDGNIDLYLTARIPQNRDIQYRTIVSDRMLMIAKRTPLLEERYDLTHNDAQHPAEARLADFAKEPFILLRPRQKMREMAENVFALHRFTPASILETNTMPSVLSLADSGCGVTFFGEIALRYARFNASLAYFWINGIEKMPILLAYVGEQENALVDDFCRCAESALNAENGVPPEEFTQESC